MRRLIVAVTSVCLLLATPSGAETVSVNGATLHYETKGKGTPLVLLHGFGSCLAEWAPLADHFAETHRVIAIDMRGHGQSTNPSGRFTHRQSAEDVLALLDSLGIARAQAIGFSSGGMTLLQLAAKYPDRLDKLVLVSASPQFPEQARAILRGASLETMPPPVLAHYRKCAARGDSQVAELVAQFRGFGDSRDDMNLAAADLGRIKATTLIVHGDSDPFFPVATAVSLHDGIAKARLWVVPGGDHSPSAGADTATFERVVDKFLAN